MDHIANQKLSIKNKLSGGDMIAIRSQMCLGGDSDDGRPGGSDGQEVSLAAYFDPVVIKNGRPHATGVVLHRDMPDGAAARPSNGPQFPLPPGPARQAIVVCLQLVGATIINRYVAACA